MSSTCASGIIATVNFFYSSYGLTAQISVDGAVVTEIDTQGTQCSLLPWTSDVLHRGQHNLTVSTPVLLLLVVVVVLLKLVAVVVLKVVVERQFRRASS